MNKTTRILMPLCITAVFSSLGIILEAYLKIPFSFLEISFAFVPILVCGMITGPFWGAACAVIVDFIATVIAGRGAYFPGFAPIVFLTGCFFGLVGLANRRCKTNKSFYVISAALVAANGLLCEAIFKTFMICIYQVYVIESHREMTWALFAGWFVPRIIYATAQAVVIFSLVLLARKQIIPTINKITRKQNG